MSIFGTIMDKIFHHGQAQAAEPKAAPATPTSAAPAPASTPAAAAAPAKLSQIDVDATLIRLAAQKGGGGNWRTSIVDLLKLLDLDSSLAARKQLAQELNVHAGADGTAEQNIALSKAVMQNLAENGGQVSESLRN
jgi:hypothetical protein